MAEKCVVKCRVSYDGGRSWHGYREPLPEVVTKERAAEFVKGWAEEEALNSGHHGTVSVKDVEVEVTG